MTARQRFAAAARAVLKGDVLAKLVFALAAAGLFYGAGAATMQFKFFPYPILRDAAEGLKAQLAIEDERLPTGFSGWREKAEAPISKPGAGRELILMTGGPFRRLDDCPTHGCLAWIVDREGRLVHKWEVDFGALIEGDAAHVGRLSLNNLNPIGLSLQADGSLIASFHGRNLFPYQVGIAKFDKAGKLLWMRHDLSHHWFDVAADGVIYTPYAEVVKGPRKFGATKLPLRCPTGAIYEEGVRAISADGELIRETSFFDILDGEGFPGLFYAGGDGCDPLHVNSVDVATAEVAARVDGVEPGDLLVSIRELSSIVLLDRDATQVKRIIVGRTAAQHSAKFLPDGDIVAFDNLGAPAAAGGSRVLKISLDGAQAETIYPRRGAEPFFSEYQGHVDISPDGERLLVASSGQGRLLEIDPATGRELWTYAEVEPTGRFRASLQVKPDGPFAHYNMGGAYYVRDTLFLGSP